MLRSSQKSNGLRSTLSPPRKHKRGRALYSIEWAGKSACFSTSSNLSSNNRISRHSEQFRTCSQSEHLFRAVFPLSASAFNHQKLNTLRTSSQYFPAPHTSYNIEMISYVLEPSMRLLAHQEFLKSAYLRNSYEQKKRFRHILRAARARWQMPSIELGICLLMQINQVTYIYLALLPLIHIQ